MGGPRGQKSVWAMAHTSHTVPAPMSVVRRALTVGGDGVAELAAAAVHRSAIE